MEMGVDHFMINIHQDVSTLWSKEMDFKQGMRQETRLR